MKIVFFVHSLASDWNNGHAHFLRGLISALAERGHAVRACEPVRSWSADNLFQEAGVEPFVEFARRFPRVAIETYDGAGDLIAQVDRLTNGADLVVVHEFNTPDLVGAAGWVRRKRDDFLLLFHDTHHRAVSVPVQIARLNLAPFDGLLAFGQSLAEVYRTVFGIERVWTFHEAADTTTFRPLESEKEADLVWIGNWGDGERSAEIRSFVAETARANPRLGVVAYGVRYPEEAIEELRSAGVAYRGAVPNYRVPEVFARAAMTVHLPRRFYRDVLPGIPTIRPFEAMACGIPLISLSWPDTEGLFRGGRDYLPVETPEEMRRTALHLARSRDARAEIAGNALETIRSRHTCRHRALELENIYEELRG